MLNNKLSLNTFIFILAIIASVEVIGLFCYPATQPQYNQEKAQQEDYTPGHMVSLSLFMPVFTNTKQGLHCIFDWIDTNSDIVMGLATIAIALFTLTLWQTSQEHSRHMEASIAVAQKAANAAEKSADALPAIERAYLVVRVFCDKAHDINIGPDEEAAPNDKVEVTIINVGKTAALLTGITYTIDIFDNTCDIDKYLSEVIENYSVIPSGTDLIDEIGERILPTLFYMTHSKWKELMLKSKTLVCLGCIHYEDVFGNPHRTVFCWNYETYVGFHADKEPKRNERT